MHDLAALYPSVMSVSIVPAGMTKFREEKGLYPLTPFTAEEAKAVIHQIEAFAEQCMKHHGSRIFYAGDELYLEAGLPIPDAEYYEGFHAIEDGVGMIASMQEEFDAAIEDAEDDGREREVSIATGVAAYGFIQSLAVRVEKKFPKIKIHVYKIENNYFGEKTITVAGLLTGHDIAEQLKGKPLGEKLYIPAVTLRHEGDLFLCGMSIDALSETLGVEIEPCVNDGYEFFEKLTEC